jgi:Dienelactone hydrolase family
MFVRLYVAASLLFLGFLAMFKVFTNSNLLPGIILIGSFMVPVTIVVFFFETNSPRNVSLYLVGRAFFAGGVLSLAITLIMVQVGSPTPRSWVTPPPTAGPRSPSVWSRRWANCWRCASSPWACRVSATRGPGVVVVPDALGMTTDLHHQADWLASAGFLAVAPDLFHQGSRMRCLFATIRQAATGSGQVFEDLEAARSWIAGRRDATGAVGVIAFCPGGIALLLAGRPGYAVSSVNYGGLPKNALEALGPHLSHRGQLRYPRPLPEERPGPFEQILGRVARGISAPGPHRSVRNSLPLHGSCHPDHQE